MMDLPENKVWVRFINLARWKKKKERKYVDLLPLRVMQQHTSDGKKQQKTETLHLDRFPKYFTKAEKMQKC